jgi:hypothetical protein
VVGYGHGHEGSEMDRRTSMLLPVDTQNPKVKDTEEMQTHTQMRTQMQMQMQKRIETQME